MLIAGGRIVHSTACTQYGHAHKLRLPPSFINDADETMDKLRLDRAS